MLIIHTSDLHLDSKLGNLGDMEKSKIRRGELVAQFLRLVDYARKHSVRAVIIAGDMFDAKARKSTVKTCLDAIKACGETDFLYLPGNHDQENVFGDEKLPENFKIFEKEWTTFSYGNVDITGAEIYKNPSCTAVLKLNAEKKNIVVLHGEISKYKNSGENAEKISLEDIKGKDIDYLALGHYHTYAEEKIDDRGVFVYSGCLEGRGFDECGEKGFVLIDTENMTHSFVPFSYRKLHEITADMRNFESFDAAYSYIGSCTDKLDGKDLVKIVFTGKYKMDRIKDFDLLKNRLAIKFFFVKTEDRTLPDLSCGYQYEKSLKGELIRAVTAATDITDEEKGEIVNYALKALAGEEL